MDDAGELLQGCLHVLIPLGGCAVGGDNQVFKILSTYSHAALREGSSA